MNQIKKAFPYLLTGLMPVAALAQNTAIGVLQSVIQPFLNAVIPVLLIIATIVFLWGVIQYITAGADEEKKTAARGLMIYGLIGLFVMVAVWGIVRILVTTFGVGQVTIPTNVGGL